MGLARQVAASIAEMPRVHSTIQFAPKHYMNMNKLEGVACRQAEGMGEKCQEAVGSQLKEG